MSTKKADGDAGARRATALICTALCAESTTATLNEDFAKVDIKFNHRDAFNNNLHTHHCQVKSGLSYKANSTDENELVLNNIGNETVSALSDSTGIIAWVPPKPSKRVFWYAIDPRTPTSTPIKIPRTQFVRPSIRYDWTRNKRYARHHDKVPQQEVSKFTSKKEISNLAKRKYKKLKQRNFKHPLFGELHITRFAWRHVTRRSKTTKRRVASLRLVPYLDTFLNRHPDRFVTNKPTFRTEGNKTVETRYIHCWYRDALVIDDKVHSLLLRIKEVVKFPQKWDKYPLGVNDIEQKATLASWWAKENK